MRDELPAGGLPPHVEAMTSDMADAHNSIFFAAINTTRMPMVITDPNQHDNPIVFANPAFMNMTGYDESELIGHNCRLLQGPESDREVVAQVRQAIENRQPIAVELLNYKKDKSSFWNGLFVSPVYDEHENLVYFFASQLDVTRRRDAEDSLRQSQKMEAVGQLTGGIAHDFNNLLTVITGFGELLTANLESNKFNPTRAKRAIESILSAATRGAELTSQLLAFAKRQKLEGRVVSIREMIRQLAPLIEKTLGSGVNLKIDDHGGQCNVRLDVTQAEMAIINIAANARDAMSGIGEFTISISPVEITESNVLFSHVEHGHYTCLAMTDTGTGMDPEVLAKITEPFFTTKGEGKGTGLGMSMVHGFVNQSGGDMKVVSEIGKGTTVHMLFKADDGAVENATIKAQRAPAISKGVRETILLVEDNLPVAQYADQVLTDFGYTVIKAENADVALELLKNVGLVDVLFSDITMPGSMNGVQLAREVAKLYPTIKILLATGYTDNAVDIVDSFGVPFDLLRKPYRLVELTNRVRAAIDGPDGIS